MQRSFLIAAAFAGLVSACGGGSEDNPPNGGNGNPPPPVFRSNVVCDLYIPELSNEQPLHIRRVANQVQPLDWSHRSGRYSGFAAFGRPDSVVQRPEDRSISLAPWDASLPHLQEMRIQIEAPLMHKSAACMLHLKHIRKDESLATLHPLRIELLTPDSAQKPLDQLYVLEGFSLLWSHFPLTRIHVSFLIDPGKYAIPNIGEKDIQICQSYARLFGPQSAACEPARLSAAGGGILAEASFPLANSIPPAFSRPDNPHQLQAGFYLVASQPRGFETRFQE